MAVPLDTVVEEQLFEAGNRLLQPPSSVDELLPILDQVENCLSRVVQSPPESMQNALSPVQKALVGKELLRHANIDVKVAAASCISEITRISAPDAPYDDDRMREVFQLIVSAFENLSDKSSRSYNKRLSILMTVAKVRSSVVMLDLECVDLIIQMFQHFLRSVRDYHPETVFTSMESIMMLIFEESEDIPVEFLAPILASLKKETEEFLPIGQKLGEKVLQNCASKLKPYLIQAVKSLGIFLDDYSDVVASICLEKSGSVVEQGDGNVSGGNPVAAENAAEMVSCEKLEAAEDASFKSDGAAKDSSLKAMTSNGIAQPGDGGSLSDTDTVKKFIHQSKCINSSSQSEQVDCLDTGEKADLEAKMEQNSKRQGSSFNSVKSDPSHIDGNKECQKMPDIRNSHCEDPSKEMPFQVSSPEASNSEAANVSSPTESGGTLAEIRSRKGRPPKKGETEKLESKPSSVSRKSSKEKGDSEVQPHRRRRKKGTAGEGKIPAVALKGENNLGSSEAKSLKLSWKIVDSSRTREGESSTGPQPSRKSRARGKSPLEKDRVKSSAEDDDKGMKTSPMSAKDGPIVEETPKVKLKRTRAPEKGKVSDASEELVGSKIKVWWPADQEYYDGVIESFDPVKKKHRVLYTDGDVERLNLKNEKWTFIEDKSVPAGGQEEADRPSPVTSSEMSGRRKKKVRTSSDLPAKQSGIVSSTRGGASSSKPKFPPAKASRKSKDSVKVHDESEDESAELDKRVGTNSSARPRGRPGKGGRKSVDDAPKAAADNPTGNDDGTPKTRSKSKQGPPKSSAKSKGKTTPPSARKSNVRGSGRMKSAPAKAKQSEEKPLVSGSSKGRTGVAKSGRKRRRG